MPLTVKSFADLNLAIARNLHRIDGGSFDVIVGIPRSGMIPAALLATHLQRPLADVEGFARGWAAGRSGTSAPLGHRVLLVDDTVNKGRAMTRAVARLRASGRNLSITRFAVYGPYQLANPFEACDIWLEELRGPRAFQWNLMKHKRLERWGLDFDGVLCRDPIKEENDDGPKYEHFLAATEPMWLPTRPVKAIITARLERYRPITERWLAAHGVEYGQLIMMPYGTKAERMAAGNRGGWKAEQARALGLEMFIESSPKQARIIAREAGIPVWCTETQELVRHDAPRVAD